MVDLFELATDGLILAGLLHLTLSQFEMFAGTNVYLVYLVPAFLMLMGAYAHYRLPLADYVLATGGMISLSKLFMDIMTVMDTEVTTGIPFVIMILILGLSVFTLEEAVRDLLE